MQPEMVAALRVADLVMATDLGTWLALHNNDIQGVHFVPHAFVQRSAPPRDEEPSKLFTVGVPLDLAASPEASTQALATARQLRNDRQPARILASTSEPTSLDHEVRDAEPPEEIVSAAPTVTVQAAASPADGEMASAGAEDEVTKALEEVAGETPADDASDEDAGPLEWLPPTAFEDDELLARVDALVVPECGVAVLDRLLLRASALGVPTVSLASLDLLNTMHRTPLPTARIAAESSEPMELADGAAVGEWFEAECSSTAAAQTIAGWARSTALRSHSEAPIYSLRQKRWELQYESGSATDYDAKYHTGVCYRRMDQRLARLVEAALPETQEPRRVLDLGCGPGSLMPYLSSIPNVELVGVDLSPEMIDIARSKYPWIAFEVGDCEALAFADGSFDAVLCSGMLHHLPSLRATLEEIRRLLKPGGALIAREPNEDHFAARHSQMAFCHLCLRHHLHVGLHRHIVDEPDAHADHREFTAATFAREVGDCLLVEEVDSDLKVAYFYDLLVDDDLYAPVAALEATLDNQPGMNLLLVARHADEPGITPAAELAVRRLSQFSPVDPSHLHATARAIEHFATRVPFPELTDSDLIAPRWDRFLPPDLKTMLVVADDQGRLDILRQRLPFDCERKLIELSALAGEEDEREFDAVVCVISDAIDVGQLARLRDSARSYGRVFLELRPGAEIVGDAESLGRWPVVALAFGHPDSDGCRWVAPEDSVPTTADAPSSPLGLRCASIPMAHSATDACLALQLASTGHEGADHIERAAARLKLGHRYSTLGPGARTLDAALEAR